MSDGKMYAYIWEFTVKTEYKMKFEQIYGPAGKWAELFKKSEGYIRTELLHDNLDSQKYITIDYWKSKSNKNDFMLKFSDDYKRLDAECSEFTLNERYIGEFDVT
jgi:heme-degrading monooxygenase HmoA